jgi:ATP-binding cassette subfamily F protein uup
VSHDRAFIDQVVTSTLVYEGPGQWREYEGGVQDWLTQSERAKALAAQAANTSPPLSQETPHPKGGAQAATPKKPTTKLSYKEQRELDGLPALMGALEQELQELQQALLDPEIFVKNAPLATEKMKRVDQLETLLLEHLERWEDLSQR